MIPNPIKAVKDVSSVVSSSQFYSYSTQINFINADDSLAEIKYAKPNKGVWDPEICPQPYPGWKNMHARLLADL